MRKVVLVVAIVVIVVLVAGLYPDYVDKPVKDGVGPMAVLIDPRFPAPETHNPLDWWQTHHMDVVNRGDLSEKDCQHCHEPATSCNNCHTYVGVKEIVAR